MADNRILEEYRLCHEEVKRIEEENSTLSSFLFGGALAAAGLVLGLSGQLAWSRMLALSVVSTILLSGLLFYVKRNASITKVVLDRARTIEIYSLPEVWLERCIDSAKRSGRVPFHSAFSIYTCMIVLYLGALWSATVILWLSHA